MGERVVTLLNGQRIVTVDHPSEMPPMTPERIAAAARILDELRVLRAEQAAAEMQRVAADVTP